MINNITGINEKNHRKNGFSKPIETIPQFIQNLPPITTNVLIAIILIK